MHFNLIKAFVLIAAAGAVASAASFSFTGSFVTDDESRFFSFTLPSPETVTLRTYSYAGGMNGMGTVSIRGGFDPILSLFTGTGTLINQNDDGDLNVSPDPVTGQYFDSYIHTTLAAGTYTVALTQYENFAIGPNLSYGFSRTGQASFTAAFGCSAGKFCDLTGDNRTANWEFDVSGASSAVDLTAVPEPVTPMLLALGLTGLGLLRRRKT